MTLYFKTDRREGRKEGRKGRERGRERKEGRGFVIFAYKSYPVTGSTHTHMNPEFNNSAF